MGTNQLRRKPKALLTPGIGALCLKGGALSLMRRELVEKPNQSFHKPIGVIRSSSPLNTHMQREYSNSMVARIGPQMNNTIPIGCLEIIPAF